MRHLLEQYSRTVLTFISTLVGLALFLTGVLYNSDLKNELFVNSACKVNGSSESCMVSNGQVTVQDAGIHSKIVEEKGIKLNVVNEKRICIGEEIDLTASELANAQRADGTDISNYIVISGAPESTMVPGEYEIKYYLRYEGSTLNKTLSLKIQDYAANASCPEFKGKRSCVFNSDCEADERCVPESEGATEKYCQRIIACSLDEDCEPPATCESGECH